MKQCNVFLLVLAAFTSASLVKSTEDYVIFHDKVTFHEGFIKCKQNGLDPLEILTQQDQENVAKFLSNVPQELGWEHGYWLFATNLGNRSTFFWLNSGRPLTYTNFHIGYQGTQPDHIDTENCLLITEMYTKVYQWHDIECHLKRKTICQKSPWICERPTDGDKLE